MTSFHLSLSSQMNDWVQERGRTGRYKDANDYIQDLIRQDQERQTKIQAMQKLVDEGFASGVSDQTAEEILEEALKRHRNR